MSDTLILETIYNSGYSASEIISHAFSEAFLYCNIHPKLILEEKDEEVRKKFYAICQLNVFLHSEKKMKTVNAANFVSQFKKSIDFSTEKTNSAAENYIQWFKMCCNLKFLFHFKEELGLELFHLFSSLSKKYNERETNKFWKNCKPQWGTIPQVFSIIDKYKEPEAKLPDRKEVIKKTFFKKEEK